MKFIQGQSGNPSGRKRGSKNRTTLIREAIEKRGRKILDKILTAAESGDLDAAKWVLSRIIPPARESAPQPIEAITGTLVERGEAILRECLDGRMTAAECAALMGSLRQQAELVEATDLQQRVERLEQYAKTNREN